MFGWFRRKNRTMRTPNRDAPPRPIRCPARLHNGQCLACEAPEAEAPELLAPLTDGNSTTYFVRQPQTPEEVEHACNAISVCCVADLRYGGTDRSIINQLGNNPLMCDYIIKAGELVRSDQAPIDEPDGR